MAWSHSATTIRRPHSLRAGRARPIDPTEPIHDRPQRRLETVELRQEVGSLGPGQAAEDERAVGVIEAVPGDVALVIEEHAHLIDPAEEVHEADRAPSRSLCPGAATAVLTLGDAHRRLIGVGAHADERGHQERCDHSLHHIPTEGPDSTDDTVGADHTVAPLDTTSRYPLLVSVPERAWLELLADVPHRITFEMANAIGDGSRTLRPSLMQRLLESVRSIKVRRLALWFADRHAQPWRERLERERVDLGTGNRTLAPQGRLDPTYRITYPRGLDDGG